jgi:probable F420-dependent oxidoreductase
MEIGVLTNTADWSLDAATMAVMTEAAGFDAIHFGEHSHIPASRETPYPGGANGEMPAGYERTLDLFVALTMAAAATTKIKLGTGICQIVQRDPIVTAKAVASVDHISDGRMVLVTGSSWNIEEMRNHGTDPATRYDLLEERVLAMREIWRSDEATFHGQFVNFDRIWSWPKPIQDPMPVFVGGNSPGAEERAIRAGTGWSPLHVPGIPDRMRAFTEKAAADSVTTSALGVAGPLSAQTIEDYENAGAEAWLHYIPMTASADEFERGLQELAEVHAQFTGAS